MQEKKVIDLIIDFHTHIFPEKIAERAIASLEKNIHNRFRSDVRAVIGGTMDALTSSMAENNIDISVVMPIATTLTQSGSINKFAKIVNETENLFSFGSLHPMQKDWESVLYDIKEKGLSGIKLHPEYQQFYIDSEESLRVLKKCEELSLTVVLHAGKDHGVDPPVHCMPERLRHALCYVSGKNIVAAHLGGWDAWDDVEKYLVGTNVYFDTAFTVDFINREQLLRIIKNHGSKKILYGTDSPWEKQSHAAMVLRALPISEDEKDDIFYKNAQKLLKID